MKDKILDAPTISNWVLERLQDLIVKLDEGAVNWERINSISTDMYDITKSN